MELLRWTPHQEARAKKKVRTMYKGLNGNLELPIDQLQIRWKPDNLVNKCTMSRDQMSTSICTHSFQVHSDCGTTYRRASSLAATLSHLKGQYNISPLPKVPKTEKSEKKKKENKATSTASQNSNWQAGGRSEACSPLRIRRLPLLILGQQDAHGP